MIQETIRCKCQNFGEPEDYGLKFLDSVLFMPSQFSSEGFYELWECKECQRRWLVEIFRDGSVRNADPPIYYEWSAKGPDKLKGDFMKWAKRDID